VVDVTHVGRERGLSDRMKPIAVRDRFVFEADREMVESDLCCKAARRSTDFRNCHEGSHIKHFCPREHQNGPSFAAHLGQPHLASIHSAPEVSASARRFRVLGVGVAISQS
jgi:hypothetical protein